MACCGSAEFTDAFLAAAAAVAGTESFIKFALFYGHEWLWQRKCMQGMIKNRIGGVT
jgi:hypothetical protein